jgi:hypothetical protein
MARPKKPIHPDMVEKLASHGCSAEQIAAILDCKKKGDCGTAPLSAVLPLS